MGTIVLIFLLSIPSCVLYALLGRWLYEDIKNKYSENPIWKFVIWFFPIGLIAIFIFKISDWIDEILDYYRRK